MSSTANKKTHIQDIRLKNNAGVSVACCQSIDSRRDTPWAERPEHATCKSCRRIFRVRYAWACHGWENK